MMVSLILPTILLSRYARSAAKRCRRGSTFPQVLRRTADGPHLARRGAAGVAARGPYEFLRHRLCPGFLGTAAGAHLLSRQSREGRGGPSGPKLEPHAGYRGADLTSMRTVIKFAGALLEDDSTVRGLARQVAALSKEGHEILVVHGGAKFFTATLKRMAIESKFIGGLRVTDRETRDAAIMVFAGLLNKRLAAAIRSEEHTSELQSRVDLVCRLLHEKKKYNWCSLRRPCGGGRCDGALIHR